MGIIKNGLHKKERILYLIKRNLEKSNTEKNYTGKSIRLF